VSEFDFLPLSEQEMSSTDSILKKLTEDLKVANQLASKAIEGMNDGGSANLDCVFLRVPRIRESKVLEAIRNAGLYCRRKTKWIGQGYMIRPTGTGQGDTNYVAVRTMTAYLRDREWDVLTFEKVD
jgi:hypothetical protein